MKYDFMCRLDLLRRVSHGALSFVSEMCAWTNNPFLLSVKWYTENFLDKHPDIANADSSFNIENYLRGERWLEPQWVIAIGDGLFRHCDVNKFGFS